MGRPYAEVEAWIWAALRRHTNGLDPESVIDASAKLAELSLDSFALLTVVIELCEAFHLDFEQIAERDFRIDTVADLLSYARAWLDEQK